MTNSPPIDPGAEIPLERLTVHADAPSRVASDTGSGAQDRSGDAASSTPNDSAASEEATAHNTDNAVARPTTAPKRQWNTSNGINAILAILVSCFAVAAYIAQLKANQSSDKANQLSEEANRLSDEANRLSDEANRLNDEAFKEQLWIDCQDQEDPKARPCIEILTSSFAGSAKRSIDPSLFNVFVFNTTTLIVGHQCSSSPVDLTTTFWLLEPGEVYDAIHDDPALALTLLLRWTKAVASNVFVGMSLCQFGFLVLLRDLRSRHKPSWTTRRRPARDDTNKNKFWRFVPLSRAALHASNLEIACGFLLLMMAIFPTLSLMVGLQTRFTGDLACGVGLAILFITFCVLEMYAQRIRTGVFSQPDEEVQDEFWQAPGPRISISEVAMAIATAVPGKVGGHLRSRMGRQPGTRTS